MNLAFGQHRPTEQAAQGGPGQYATVSTVSASADFYRVDALPRRTWTPESVEPLVEKWTKVFRSAFGAMRLLPWQALALEEGATVGGLVVSASVGSGKTLVMFLLPQAMQTRRPICVMPANLITERLDDWQVLSKHWKLGPLPKMVALEEFQTVKGKNRLAELNPDLMIIDEAHGLKSAKAARTRRFKRWLSEPACECRVVVMTGSLTKRHIADYAHLCLWALGAAAPVPVDQNTLVEWDSALAEKLELGTRSNPGCLLRWYDGPTDGVSFLEQGRRGFQRRFAETPGVICTFIKQSDLPTLDVVGHQLDHPAGGIIDEAFKRLREDKELPDGQQLVDAIEWYRHSKELALGFFLKWRDPAPQEWLSARKGWFSFCREKLARSRTYDSPDDLAKAFPTQPEWLFWRAVRDSYDPVTIPVWLDTGIAELCAEWLTGGWGAASPGKGGVVFTEHVAFGEMVAHLAGLPYFGAGGVDSANRSIKNYKDPAGCVASIGSNGKGRNLQHYCRMLVPSPLPNGPGWEQLLGREHRQGQKNPVRVDVLFGCEEAYRSFWQGVADCRYAEQSQGLEQKLTIARLVVGNCPTSGWPWGCAPAEIRIV